MRCSRRVFLCACSELDDGKDGVGVPRALRCTKAVEGSDMPKPQFNGQLESYDEWVEKLQQWFGGM